MSSRGWRSAPRDLTGALTLARHIKHLRWISRDVLPVAQFATVRSLVVCASRDDMPSLPLISIRGIKPFHVVGDTCLERITWFVAEAVADIREIRLGEILIMGMRILDIIRFEISAERVIQHLDQLVEG